MNYHLTIIGAGPRGLAALEYLFSEYANGKGTEPLKVALFEKGRHKGCSWVYYPEQPETNWLNILDRPLDLKARKPIELNGNTIPGFPGYHQWNAQDRMVPDWDQRDSFTSRGRFGRYLKQRFDSLSKELINQGYIDFFNARVVNLERVRGKFVAHTEEGKAYTSREVLLCVGHQNTQTADQLKKWEDHAHTSKEIVLFKEPYPVSQFREAIPEPSKAKVALRGFGLSMIDIARALTEGLGGTFSLVDEATREMDYIPGVESVPCLIPFSLDGLPLAPKPLNKALDLRFKPGVAPLAQFRKTLNTALKSPGNLTGIQFLIEPASNLCAEVFNALGTDARAHQLSHQELQDLIAQWVQRPDLIHPLFVAHDQAAPKTIAQFIAMATGAAPSSLDYCFGQVWRHLQPLLYDTFAFTELNPEVMEAVIHFDERIKRYSYGPPVDAMQQLLALFHAGVLKVIVVDDPDIELVPEGWLFYEDGAAVTANVMINTVLDSPDLETVTSPLIRSLVQQGLLAPYREGLGAKINRNGLAVSRNGEEVKGLALLGRLAKGSLLGTDAILECFNPYISDWAKGFLSRLPKAHCT